MKHTASEILFNTVSLLILFAFTSCSKSCQYEKPEQSNTIGMSKVACDESFANVIAEEIGVFEFRCPDATIVPYYVNQDAVIENLIDLKMDLGISAKKLTKEQVEYIIKKTGFCETQRIAVDAVAVIVNKENPIDSLSLSELTTILNGKVSTWKELGYNDGDSINVIFDRTNSSILDFASEKFMNGNKFAKNVYVRNNSSELFSVVSAPEGYNNIAMIGVTWLNDKMDGYKAATSESIEYLEGVDTLMLNKDQQVKVLKIYKEGDKKAYKPFQQHIFDGTYPLYRNIYAICTSSGGSPAKGFFDFITSAIGQKLMMQTGILPSVVRPRIVSLN